MSIIDRFTQMGEELGQISQRRQNVSRLHSELASNLAGDMERFPQGAQLFPQYQARIKKALERYLPGRDGLAPVDASLKLFLPADHMSAYICFLPPMDAGRELTEEDLAQALEEAKVVSGLQPELLAEFFKGRKYLHIFPAACGKAPVDGKDGAVTKLFEPRPPAALAVRPGMSLDFDAQSFLPVRAGQVLCQIQPDTPGEAGCNVLGEALSCREALLPDIPLGKNTELSPDGLSLKAAADGLLYLRDGKFCVEPVTLLEGEVSGTVTIKRGTLYVQGGIAPDAQVTAPGDIIVEGGAAGAQICSTQGSVRLCGGVKGGRVKASGQVQARFLDNAAVEAGEGICTQRLRECEAVSGGWISAVDGEGMIAGGSISAKSQVLAACIGDGSGQVTRIAVGYMPEVTQELDSVAQKLKGVQETLEKLRKSVSALRMGGETLSPEKRALLSQLLEQRTLYEGQEKELLARQRGIQEKLRSCRSGAVKCAQLFPKVCVRIGDRTGEFRSQEKQCNIHIYMGQVVVK